MLILYRVNFFMFLLGLVKSPGRAVIACAIKQCESSPLISIRHHLPFLRYFLKIIYHIKINARFVATEREIWIIQCPDGEIGKRCGLRSRWSKILESSSLSSGTASALNRLTFNKLGGFLFFGVN